MQCQGGSWGGKWRHGTITGGHHACFEHAYREQQGILHTTRWPCHQCRVLAYVRVHVHARVFCASSDSSSSSSSSSSSRSHLQTAGPHAEAQPPQPPADPRPHPPPAARMCARQAAHMLCNDKTPKHHGKVIPACHVVRFLRYQVLRYGLDTKPACPGTCFVRMPCQSHLAMCVCVCVCACVCACVRMGKGGGPFGTGNWAVNAPAKFMCGHMFVAKGDVG